SILMFHPIDVAYFDLFRLRFIIGAPWRRSQQDAEPRPAVITEALAVEAFGSAQEALGRVVRDGEMHFRIAGVVADNRHYGPDGFQGPAAYVPITMVNWWDRAHMAVLVDRADAGLGDRLREAVWRAEPDLPMPIVRSLDDWAGDATARMRFESLLFTTFGVVALLLVAGGLSGTLLYTVGRRRRELGIRLALGDVPARLARRVLWLGVRIVAVGCTIGVAGAWAFGRLLESHLFGVEPGDALTTAGAVTVLLVVTLAASWLPARRAAATDPMETLRSE
ncbi:MAG: FtsX-like permease family protein, partial [Longimicrobiales bacterium]